MADGSQNRQAPVSAPGQGQRGRESVDMSVASINMTQIYRISASAVNRDLADIPRARYVGRHDHESTH
jgi:hypothetical protein